MRGAGESKDRANREGARMRNHRGNAAMWQQIEQRTDVKRHPEQPVHQLNTHPRAVKAYVESNRTARGTRGG
jgi:hypothetical protein